MKWCTTIMTNATWPCHMAMPLSAAQRLTLSHLRHWKMGAHTDEMEGFGIEFDAKIPKSNRIWIHNSYGRRISWLPDNSWWNLMGPAIGESAVSQVPHRQLKQLQHGNQWMMWHDVGKNFIWLVVDWLTYPFEKWWSSSVAMMKFPIYGKNKIHVPNHQPVIESTIFFQETNDDSPKTRMGFILPSGKLT